MSVHVTTDRTLVHSGKQGEIPSSYSGNKIKDIEALNNAVGKRFYFRPFGNVVVGTYEELADNKKSAP